MTQSLRIIFAGTPAFAVTALQALLQSSHEIIAVYTQPDRPAGRGQKLTASPVKALALEHHLPIYQPVSLKNEDNQRILHELNADLMIVAAYGLLLPLAVLQALRLGCINIHASLLPRWRGAAPIQRAILAGDSTTGITIMQMEQGLDTGPMLLKRECKIEATDTSAALHDRLAEVGAAAIMAALEQWHELRREAQDTTLVTYASKIVKTEAQIDWTLPAEILARQVRAFNPWPVSYTHHAGHIIRIWQATALPGETADTPGKIIRASHEGIDIATAHHLLRLLTLQLPGGRPLKAAEILHGQKSIFKAGECLGGEKLLRNSR